VSALRFLYKVTLKRDWPFELIPAPKSETRMPVILSPDEVLRLLQAARSFSHTSSSARCTEPEKWLTEQAGFPRTGFAAQGFGATRFAAPNTNRDGSDDPVGRQKNRRVEIVTQRKK
jgi:hypothetical protein